MKKYTICASETVFYEIEIEAENEEQAKEDVLSGNIDITDHACDSAGFQIDSIRGDH